MKERSAIGSVVKSDREWECRMTIGLRSGVSIRSDKQCDHVISVRTMEMFKHMWETLKYQIGK